MEKFFESLKDSKGVLMVSGVMTYDAPIAIAKAEEVGFTLEEHITEDEWSAFKFRVK
jgi:ribosomal protein L11 methylase PrmA